MPSKPVKNLAQLRHKLAEKLAAYENGFIDGATLDRIVGAANGICKVFLTEIALKSSREGISDNITLTPVELGEPAKIKQLKK